MDKTTAIKKAMENIEALTKFKWEDVRTSAQMVERLNGIVGFMAFAYNLSAKEYEELNTYKNERVEYWKNKYLK